MNILAYAAKEIATMSIAIRIIKISDVTNTIAQKKVDKAKTLVYGPNRNLKKATELADSAERWLTRGVTLRKIALKVHADPRK